MKESVDLAEGTIVGNWKIGPRLGGGGQGTVWAAKPTTTRRSPPRALKACFSGDPTDRARFEREVELLRRCENAPNILRIIDADLAWIERVSGAPAFAYHVSERCDGSLEELRQKRKLGGAGARLDLFSEACAAVQYLHEMSTPLIHRDIKPPNFLIAQDPRRLVLADFGIARPIATEEALTQIQEVVGTQHFRAPEVSAGQPPTVRSDIFSLGRVLEWLLTDEVSTDLSTRPVPRGGQLADEVCDRLDAIIARATQPVASRRYETVTEMIAAIPELWLALRPRADSTQVVEMPASPKQALKSALAYAKADDRHGWNVTVDIAPDEQWARGGELVHLSTGERVEIQDQVSGGDVASVIRLQARLYQARTGDAVEVSAGCDRDIIMCREKFNNVVNYGGFPDLPTKNPFDR